MTASLKDYIGLARPDHWFKNIFAVPGTVTAAALTQTQWLSILPSILIGYMSLCLVASSNYVINEWIDAQFDKFHPRKKNRPSAMGKIKGSYVILEYLLIASAGLFLAYKISDLFFLVSCILFLMGILYNVRPIRLKDRMCFDVLSESFNNPLRFLLGWFIVTNQVLPPSSILIAYWMGGAFLMGIKRFSELRSIGDPQIAGQYRRSFYQYTQESLLVHSFFYAVCSAFFLAIFLFKYRIELLLSFPFISLLFTWYLKIGWRKDSPVQNPEKLYQEKSFLVYLIFLTTLLIILFHVDIPQMQLIFNKTLRTADIISLIK